MGIWPAGFDKDDVMYTNTAYGDYPTYLPQYAQGKDFSKGLLPDGCCSIIRNPFRLPLH